MDSDTTTPPSTDERRELPQVVKELGDFLDRTKTVNLATCIEVWTAMTPPPADARAATRALASAEKITFAAASKIDEDFVEAQVARARDLLNATAKTGVVAPGRVKLIVDAFRTRAHLRTPMEHFDVEGIPVSSNAAALPRSQPWAPAWNSVGTMHPALGSPYFKVAVAVALTLVIVVVVLRSRGVSVEIDGESITFDEREVEAVVSTDECLERMRGQPENRRRVCFYPEVMRGQPDGVSSQWREKVIAYAEARMGSGLGITELDDADFRQALYDVCMRQYPANEAWCRTKYRSEAPP